MKHVKVLDILAFLQQSAAQALDLSNRSVCCFVLLDRLDNFAEVIGHFLSGIPGKRKVHLVGAPLIQQRELAFTDHGFCDFSGQNSKAEAEFKQTNKSDVFARAKLWTS